MYIFFSGLLFQSLKNSIKCFISVNKNVMWRGINFPIKYFLALRLHWWNLLLIMWGKNGPRFDKIRISVKNHKFSFFSVQWMLVAVLQNRDCEQILLASRSKLLFSWENYVFVIDVHRYKNMATSWYLIYS